MVSVCTKHMEVCVWMSITRHSGSQYRNEEVFSSSQDLTDLSWPVLLNCSCYFYSSSSLDCLTFCCLEFHESLIACDHSELALPSVCCPLFWPVSDGKMLLLSKVLWLCLRGKMRHLKVICIPVSAPVWRTTLHPLQTPCYSQRMGGHWQNGVGVFNLTWHKFTAFWARLWSLGDGAPKQWDELVVGNCFVLSSGGFSRDCCS